MKRIKIIFGLLWSFAGLIVILILFPGLTSMSASLAKLSFMKINPNYSGGEIAHQISEGSYTVDVRKPVFEGLTGERKKGFVQVDWRGDIPILISDTIDYDYDGKPDFSVMIDRDKPETKIVQFDERVGDIMISTSTSYGWAIRTEVRK